MKKDQQHYSTSAIINSREKNYFTYMIIDSTITYPQTTPLDYKISSNLPRINFNEINRAQTALYSLPSSTIKLAIAKV